MDTSTSLPLDIDLNSIDTSFPLIANGAIADFVVEKIEAGTTKANAPMLKLTLKTTSPVASVKGDTLNAGVSVFHNINLSATGKATPQMVAQNIAAFAQAVGLTGSLGEFINGGYMAAQGRPVRVKVAYIPEGPDKSGTLRKAKNEVGSFIKQ
jgi:hypothetical protein